MASVRNRTRKDGSMYFAVLFREGKKQTSVSWNDPVKAHKFADLVDQVGPEQARKIADAQQEHVLEMTLTEWCNHYIDHLTGVEDATPDRYRAFLRNDITPVIGALPLTAVDEDAIDRWVLSMKGASGKTIANKHGFLSAALDAAVPKRIPANPCANTRLPRQVREDMVFLTPTEFYILADNLTSRRKRVRNDRFKPLVTFLALTGVRFSEATSLLVADIDADGYTARVNKAWKYSTKRGGRYVGPPKSKKSTRTINIAQEALDVLDLERPSTDLLFPTITGSSITAQNFHENCWRPTMATVEPIINKRPRPHDLRHSCASWMIAAGVPLPVIQAHLGHESIQTTVNLYGHIDRSSHAAAAMAISSVLAGASRPLG